MINIQKLMKKNIILSAALMLFGLTAPAQTTITFDTEDYKKISVYDSWEESPFRAENPIIDWEAGVVANPDTTPDEVLGYAPNATGNVLSLRRSRYGSNTFGVRIDLKEPVRMTKQLQYIHVMTCLKNKPASSRMMVIGLGKRLEESWNWQTGEDEQFWAITTANVHPKEGWQDIVASFKGFSYSKEENADSGIDIYSLVIIPDVRSPHADATDWYAYFDEIVIDNSPVKRFTTEKYALNDDKEAAQTRNDRKLNSVGLTVDGNSYSSEARKGKLYTDNTTSSVFSAIAGDEVQPTFNYTGGWMSGYVYVDWGRDGVFHAFVNDNGTPSEGSDVASYSALMIGEKWYKSDGTTVGNGNTIGGGVPKFTVPAGTVEGFYRMRYKVDWNSIDPAGNASDGNKIIANGGNILDLMLDVHGENVTVNASQLNGDIVLAVDNSVLQNYIASYGQPLMVKIVPAPGFVQYGFTLKYGYNVNAKEQLDDNGNPNWIQVEVPYSDVAADGTYTIPAEYMRGSQVSIKGDMQQVQPYIVEVAGLSDNTLGGAVYANIETHHGDTINATQFFSVEQLTPIAIEGYDAAITLEGRVVKVAYVISAAPYTQVASLAELKNYKLYHIKAKSGEGFFAWNPTLTDEYVSLRGVTNHSYNGMTSNGSAAVIFQEEVNPYDTTVVWQIYQEDGKYYLYQPARKAYVTRSGRDYKFTTSKTALDAVYNKSDDKTFGIHAGGSYSDQSTYFACIVTNEATCPVRNWTKEDHGSVLYIMENPNVYLVNYTVEVAGHVGGGLSFEGNDYAHGATLTSTSLLTSNDIVAKNIFLHTAQVSVDSERGTIRVAYSGPSINTGKYYTLECRSVAAHNTERFIGDNGAVINGRSTQGTYFAFEPGPTVGTYYIKSVVSGKYINSDGANISASTTKSTAWTLGVPTHTPEVVTFGISGDKYLNNNGSRCTDGTCVNLQPNTHPGGPGSGNACSLWALREYTPEDGEGTGVSSLTSTNQPATVIYDLMGRRVQNPVKGIYIVNGTKVLLK